MKIEFKNQKVIVRRKEYSPKSTQVIMVKGGNLYKLQGAPIRALVHNMEHLCELWHKRMENLHHSEFPILKDIVTGLPNFSID